MFGLDEVRGGSGWGAGCFAGPTGARQPSQTELGQAEHQVTNNIPTHDILYCIPRPSSLHMYNSCGCCALKFLKQMG